MRKRIFEIIETAKENDVASNIYDIFMMITIIISLIPLTFKEEYQLFVVIERVATGIFIIDYLLRIYTADYKLNKKAVSFIIYPFTPMAIIDLICIIPSLNIISKSFRLVKIIRLFRTFRVFRIFKAIRYSKSIMLIKNVFKNSKRSLFTVGMLAVLYVLISAMVIFNAEPETFATFFDAVYWATVSLTTMGYGDIYPITTIGRVITMISSIFGIAIIALPSGIITAGLMEQINKQATSKKLTTRLSENTATVTDLIEVLNEIIENGQIDYEEYNALSGWIRKYSFLAGNKIYDEIASCINEIIKDGYVDDEELKMLYEKCKEVVKE